MSARVSGGDDWQTEVAEGSHEWRLNYTCPTCSTSQAITLQPAPWSEPDEHPTPERLRTGQVRHRDVEQLNTQVWCHRCGHGADVVVAVTRT